MILRHLWQQYRIGIVLIGLFSVAVIIKEVAGHTIILLFLWRQYGLGIGLIGLLFVALVVNWIAIQRWRSGWAILLGGVLAALSGLVYSIGVERHECGPTNWEWCNMEDLFIVPLSIFTTVVYLVLASLMLSAYRRLVWKNSKSLYPVEQHGKIALWLLMAAFLGFAVTVFGNVFVESGVFVPWQKLAIPATVWQRAAGVPEDKMSLPLGVVEKVQRILWMYYGGIAVSTNQDRILFATVSWDRDRYASKPPSWQLILDAQHTDIPTDERDCGLLLLVPPPPGQAIARERGGSCDNGNLYLTEAAILSDGSFWIWQNHITLTTFLPGAILIGPFAGFLIGLILAMRWEIHLRENQNAH
jgi:hypothetical protein